MIVDQAQIDRIRGWRSKERVLRLPVNRGPMGERKRCPMREGGTYTLKPRPEYARWLAQADELPRARGVLWLIDRCLQPGRSVTITVLTPPCLDGDEWVVVFVVGRHEVIDRPVYLAARGDYTLERSQAAKGEDCVLMPLEKDLAKAREKAKEDRIAPNLAALKDAEMAMGALNKSLMSMKARNELRRLERGIQKLAAQVAADGAVTIPVSDCVQCSGPASGPQPAGTKPVVRLEPAA